MIEYDHDTKVGSAKTCSLANFAMSTRRFAKIATRIRRNVWDSESKVYDGDQAGFATKYFPIKGSRSNSFLSILETNTANSNNSTVPEPMLNQKLSQSISKPR